MSLFKKIGSLESELATSMEKSLILNRIENRHSFDKISKAADHLNAAAEIFDNTGMHSAAEVITRLLEKIANDDVSLSPKQIDELINQEISALPKEDSHPLDWEEMGPTTQRGHLAPPAPPSDQSLEEVIDELEGPVTQRGLAPAGRYASLKKKV